MLFDKFKKKTAVPLKAQNNVERWKEMYKGENKKGIHSLGLPAAISSELARLATIEMKAKVSGSDVCSRSIERLTSEIRGYTEIACALGGGMLRPYFDGNEIITEFYPADRFTITAFDNSNSPVGCIFKDCFSEGDYFYTRLEEHGFSENTYFVTNKAYRSRTPSDIGVQVPLNSVKRWEDLADKVEMQNVHRPLFVYLKMPNGDIENFGGKIGVSVFARAEDLIHQADLQFSRLLWEFEGGELAIDASFDALRINDKGFADMPRLNKRLFRGLGIDAGDRDLYSVFSPQLRDASLINGLNLILARIEDVCGLARGTFSECSLQAKTATEIKLLNQRSYATVCDIQRQIKTAYQKLCQCISALCTLYSLEKPSEVSVSIEFDDSIITDREAEFDEKLQLVQAGIMSGEEFREWYFG